MSSFAAFRQAEQESERRRARTSTSRAFGGTTPGGTFERTATTDRNRDRDRDRGTTTTDTGERDTTTTTTTTTPPTTDINQQMRDAQRAAERAQRRAIEQERARIEEQRRRNAHEAVSSTLTDFGFSDAQAGSLSDWAWDLIVDGATPERILLELPQRAEFNERFPAIRQMQEQGLTPPSARDYVEFENTVQDIVGRFGLPPEFHDSTRITQLLTGQVSSQTLERRLDTLSREVLSHSESIRDYYRSNFGVDGLTDGAILASAFTPGVSPDTFQRRISATQVGGTAAQFGFDRETERSMQLAEMGVDLQRAQDLFGRAQTAVPMFARLSERHRDPSDPFDIFAFEEALVFEDPNRQRQMRRVVAQEESMFSPQRLFGQEQEGGVVGLRQA